MTLPNRLLTDLTSTELVFTSADVDALLRAQGIKAPQRRELTAAALASDEVIAIGRDDGGAVTYTTREILRLRGRLTELTAALHGSRDHAPPQAALDKEIRRLERKARENGRDAADMIGALNHVGDERGLAIFHGAPGTGKSKVLESVARVYDNAGSRLVALATDRRAAAEMGRDAGVPGRTVAKLLEDLGQGRERLDRDTVVILDEAGMLGLRRMVQLLEHVKDGNAKLIMGGDDRQIPALEAGDPFAAMITQVGGFELTRINRQKDPADKQATTQVRGGAAVSISAPMPMPPAWTLPAPTPNGSPPRIMPARARPSWWPTTPPLAPSTSRFATC